MSPTPHTPSPTSNSNTTAAQKSASLVKTPQAITKNNQNTQAIVSLNAYNSSKTVNVSNYIKELEISEGQLSSCLK